MKIHIFQSSQGDCLLLQGGGGGNVLCDGGMSTSMRAHVRGRLGNLVGPDGKLDFIYLSHIDRDHISGVLQLLRDALDWKVFDFHRQNGGNSVREPDCPRPPEIGGLWHNAFRAQAEDNEGEIERLLAATGPLLSGSNVEALVRTGQEALNIALSVPEAIEVSNLCRADLLDIPVNRVPGSNEEAKLLFLADGPRPFSVGGMTFTQTGPTARELEDLRDGWNNWLRDNRTRVKDLHEEMQRRVQRFAAGGLAGSPFDLSDWNGIADIEGVTTPNVASLVFMVEENGSRVLLTGDSQQDRILDGLTRTGFLKDGHIHLDVLKVQHHGSEHNMDPDFARRVSADHYIFCGNGAHGNPEPHVLRTIFKSRVGPASRRALAPEAQDRPFTFWFSTTAAQQPAQSARRHNFEGVEQLVAALEANSNGLLSAEFVDGDFSTLTV